MNLRQVDELYHDDEVVLKASRGVLVVVVTLLLASFTKHTAREFMLPLIIDEKLSCRARCPFCSPCSRTMLLATVIAFAAPLIVWSADYAGHAAVRFHTQSGAAC
jgi:hypothetical protein